MTSLSAKLSPLHRRPRTLLGAIAALALLLGAATFHAHAGEIVDEL